MASFFVTSILYRGIKQLQLCITSHFIASHRVSTHAYPHRYALQLMRKAINLMRNRLLTEVLYAWLELHTVANSWESRVRTALNMWRPGQ